MLYRIDLYSIILFGATAVSLVVILLLWQRRHVHTVPHLIVLQLAIALWTVASGFEASGTTVALKFFWSKVAYLGTLTTPVLFFLFAREVSQTRKRLSLYQGILLFIFPLVTIVLALINEQHHWIWKGIHIDPVTNIAVYYHGFWFWMLAAYSYAMLAGALLFLHRAISRFPAAYKLQMKTLMFAALFPIAGNLIYIFDVNPIPGLEWTPVAFTATGLVLAWAILKLHIFKLIPVARNRLVENMVDGVIVLDYNALIIDINPAALAILGRSLEQTIGEPLLVILPECEKIDCEAPTDNGQAQRTLVLERSETKIYYELTIQRLLDARNDINGRLIVMHDVTRRKQAEDERERLIKELQAALTQVKTLSGLLPICSSCKKIRDDQGYWHHVETYVREHSGAEFSHSICPDCMEKLYPNFAKKRREAGKVEQSPE